MMFSKSNSPKTQLCKQKTVMRVVIVVKSAFGLFTKKQRGTHTTTRHTTTPFTSPFCSCSSSSSLAIITPYQTKREENECMFPNSHTQRRTNISKPKKMLLCLALCSSNNNMACEFSSFKLACFTLPVVFWLD